MTKEEILDYVMSTPENTNRAVLSDMLDSFSSSSGGGGLAVMYDYEHDSLDKTWQEIHDALESGTSVTIVSTNADDSGTGYYDIGVVVGCYKAKKNYYSPEDPECWVCAYHFSGSAMTTELFKSLSADGTLKRVQSVRISNQ